MIKKNHVKISIEDLEETVASLKNKLTKWFVFNIYKYFSLINKFLFNQKFIKIYILIIFLPSNPELSKLPEFNPELKNPVKTEIFSFSVEGLYDKLGEKYMFKKVIESSFKKLVG